MWDARRRGRIVGAILLVSVLGLVGCSILQPKMTVDIAASQTEGVTPMVVEFSPIVVGEVETCYWDFGDGETSNDVNPVHVYRTPGTYDVSLSVTLTNGSSGTVKKERLITVNYVDLKTELTPLYWLNANDGTIHRGDRAGYEESVVVQHIYHGGDLAVAGGYIFWTAGESIYRAHYDGTGKKAIINNQAGLHTVTVDGERLEIYWACVPTSPTCPSDCWQGSLKRANVGGADRAIIETYSVSSDHYTWWLRADSGGGRVCRYYDDDNYNWPIAGAPQGTGDGRLQWMVFSAPLPSEYATDRIKTTMNGITALALDAGRGPAYYVYWIEGSSIKRCRVDGSDETRLLTGLSAPRSVAADVIEGKMYWSDQDGIHRADLDGTNAELIYPGVRADVLVIQES